MALSQWNCVLAGGDGRRLEQFTSQFYSDGRPKQFCALHGPQTMIEQTLKRATMLAPPKQTLISVCKKHLRWRGVFAHDPDYLLSIQPHNAGTGPAVLLATLQIAQHDPQALIALWPSDHYISDDLRWTTAVREAIAWIEQNPQMFVMLGVEPLYPESAYGWLLPHHSGQQRAPPWPAKFVEKPELTRAEQLFHDGAFWNTMMLVYRCDTMLQMMARLRPLWWQSLQQTQNGKQTTLEEVYSSQPPFDFSHDFLEVCSDRMHVLPVRQVEWNDLGDRERLLYIWEKWPPSTPFFSPPLHRTPMLDTTATETPMLPFLGPLLPMDCLESIDPKK